MADLASSARGSERRESGPRGWLRSFASAQGYGLVLLLIVASYVLATSLSEPFDASVVLVVQIGAVWLALRTSRARRQLRLAADGLLLVAAGAALVNLLPGAVATLRPWVSAASGILYVLAPFSILRHLAFRRAVDGETMLGALAAYLSIGMAFAFMYRFLGAIQESMFFGEQGDGTLSQALFFSFVTLTTTGYGDLVPAGNPGQSLAILEALMGQLFLVTAVGKLVSAWRPRGWQDLALDDEEV